MTAIQEVNKLILEELLKVNAECPDQRFGQLLINCGVTIQELRLFSHNIDYFEESERSFIRISEYIGRLKDANSKKK